MRPRPAGISASDLPPQDAAWAPLFLAFTVSLTATLGALFIGEVMGQVPCGLCWYQRIFMFPLPVLLGVAAFRSDVEIWRYAFPLAIAGWGFAAYHGLTYYDLIPKGVTPCTADLSCSGAAMTILGSIPIPVLSLIAFTLVLGSLEAVRRRSR
jgi:disulfide bond formation protein DsbB